MYLKKSIAIKEILNDTLIFCFVLCVCLYVCVFFFLIISTRFNESYFVYCNYIVCLISIVLFCLFGTVCFSFIWLVLYLYFICLVYAFCLICLFVCLLSCLGLISFALRWFSICFCYL